MEVVILQMSWKELSPFSGIRSRMDGLLEDIDREDYEEHTTATPPVDIINSRDEIIVLVDLPGVTKDGVKLETSSDVLEVMAERKSKFEDYEHLIRERSPREYYRSLKLPMRIDDTAARASFANGVLEIHLPKLEVSMKKMISID